MTETPLDFAGLYRRHAPDVLRFALYLSGDRMHAEDIVSDTFVRVWGARDRLELPTVRAYLFAIARNVFLQSRRRQERQESIEAWIETMVDTSTGPQESFDLAAKVARTLQALQALPEPDRAALLLRAEEISYDEIATTLGISPVAARVRVHRARLLLARRTSQEES